MYNYYQPPLLNLHSTMFIFIFHFLRFIKTNFLIYIPLCLYLYPRGQLIASDNEVYLHSTMFIFIWFFRHGSQLLLLYLHSTMFIFIFYVFFLFHLLFFHLHSTMFIFIFYSELYPSETESYLHSTMFIFTPLYNFFHKKYRTGTF